MSLNIKNITKQITNSMKDIFGSTEMLMEEVSITTVIRNELFLANKDWIRGYKSFLKEPEDKGGLFKMLSDLKNIVTSKQIVNSREQFLSFSKQYRKFLQQCLYIVHKDINFKEVSSEDFKDLLKAFPEIIICLTKEIVETNNWQDIIIEQLKEEFNKYVEVLYDNSFEKTIKVKRITGIGSISVYSNAKKNYLPIRNYLVLQNALLTNLEILTDEAQKNPFIYINAFTRQEEYSILNKEYMIGIRKNINKKIFNILNLNNNSIFFGFINLMLIKDNLPFLLKTYDIGLNNNLFQVFMNHIYETNNEINIEINNEINIEINIEELNLSLIHEVSQYMNIDSEDCEWENVSSYALENFLFLLKRTAFSENKSLDLEIYNGSNNTGNISFFAKLLNLYLTKNSSSHDVKEIDKKIIEFIIKNFKYLTVEQKEREYRWLLNNTNDKSEFDVILMSLARDNALMDENDKYTNEIKILLNIYIEDTNRYKHIIDINYVLWLNRYNQKVWVFADNNYNDINIINTIPNKKFLGINNNSFISLTLKKLNQVLININTEEEQDRFFFFIEKENKKLLGTLPIRSLLEGYRLCNKEFKEILDLMSNDTEDDLYRKILLDKELALLVLKEKDFDVNQVLNDSYLLNTNKLFKGIKLKSSLLEKSEDNLTNKNDILKIYEVKSTSFKINHFLYAMSYQYIGDASFVFEEEFSNFINQQRDKKSFENISSNEILLFIKDWIYRASREGYLVNKLEEIKMEKQLDKLEKEIILEDSIHKERVKVRKKI